MDDLLDGVLIDTSEDECHLILSGAQKEWNFLLPREVAKELLRASKREIEPWVMEGERHGPVAQQRCL